MDQEDFYDLVADTVRLFLPRIPEKYVSGFESILHAGEYRMVVDDLVCTVVGDHISVTPSGRDALYRLVRHLKHNEELLTKLDGLAVLGEDAGQ